MLIRNLFLPVCLSVFSCGKTGGFPPFGGDEPLPTPVNTLNANSPIGTNIAPIASISPGWVFIDIYPKSTALTSNECAVEGWGTGPTLDADEAGWARSLSSGQCADVFLMDNMSDRYPAGTYVMLWEGNGSFNISGDVTEITHSMSEEFTTTEAGLKRITFTVNSDNQNGSGIFLRIYETDSSDYMRNIRIIMPGGICGSSETELDFFAHCSNSRGGSGSCASGETCYDFESVYWDRFTETYETMQDPKAVFHPVYLDTYRRYRAIRFMKWMRSEYQDTANWADRVALNRQSFTPDPIGVPYDYYFPMANILNTDIWINPPVRATDDFHTEFAHMVRDRLNPGLKIYLEWGNEIWNNLQPAPWPYALEQANAAGIGGEDAIKVARYTARRSVEVFNVWQTELGDRSSDLIRVLAGWAARSDVSTAMVDFENAYESTDALAIGPYIGPDRRFADDTTAFDAMSVDDIFNEINNGNVINSGTSLPELRTMMDTHATIASDRDLKLITYEFGQHMVATDAPTDTVDNFLTVNRDSRMGTAYTTHLTNWREAGGHENFHFLNEDFYNQNGFFGLREYQTQTTSPKLDAVNDFIDANPCWWDDC